MSEYERLRGQRERIEAEAREKDPAVIELRATKERLNEQLRENDRLCAVVAELTRKLNAVDPLQAQLALREGEAP